MFDLCTAFFPPHEMNCFSLMRVCVIVNLGLYDSLHDLLDSAKILRLYCKEKTHLMKYISYKFLFGDIINFTVYGAVYLMFSFQS